MSFQSSPTYRFGVTTAEIHSEEDLVLQMHEDELDRVTLRYSGRSAGAVIWIDERTSILKHARAGLNMDRSCALSFFHTIPGTYTYIRVNVQLSHNTYFKLGSGSRKVANSTVTYGANRNSSARLQLLEKISMGKLSLFEGRLFACACDKNNEDVCLHQKEGDLILISAMQGPDIVRLSCSNPRDLLREDFSMKELEAVEDPKEKLINKGF